MIVAGYCVLNEADWLELSIRSIYEAVDKIIIVEGAERNFWFSCSPDGLSVDGTEEVIRNYPDTGKKIVYIKHGWVDWQGDLRNVYLSMLPPQCWFLLIDGDEIYERQELAFAFSKVESPEFRNFNSFSFRCIVFQNDIYHGGFIQHIVPPKLFRITPGVDVGCSWLQRDRREGSDDGIHIRPVIRADISDVILYHFGFARNWTRLLNRDIWLFKYLVSRKEFETASRRFGVDKEFLLSMEDSKLKDFMLSLHPLYLLRTQGGPMRYSAPVYEGDYPFEKEIIEKRWNEIKDKE